MAKNRYIITSITTSVVPFKISIFLLSKPLANWKNIAIISGTGKQPIEIKVYHTKSSLVVIEIVSWSMCKDSGSYSCLPIPNKKYINAFTWPCMCKSIYSSNFLVTDSRRHRKIKHLQAGYSGVLTSNIIELICYINLAEIVAHFT